MGALRSGLGSLNLAEYLRNNATPVNTLQPSSNDGSVLTSVDARAQWAAVPGLSTWRTVIHGSSGITAGIAAGTRFLTNGDGIAASGGASIPQLFAIDDDLDIAGYSAEIRMVGHVHTNAAAPGVTFTFGVQTVGPTGGGVGVIGWGVTGSTAAEAVVTTPALTTMTRTEGSSAAFAGHASSPYALYVTTSGTTAANSHTGLHWEVQLRWVPA